MPHQESGVNKHQISLLFIVMECEEAALDEAEDSRLEVHGGEEERVAIFVDEGFGFGAAFYLVDVEGDPSGEACCDKGADQGDDGDDDGYDVNHDCGGGILPESKWRCCWLEIAASAEDLSLEQKWGP